MSTKYTRSGEVIWEELDGEALLIDTENQSAWVLNASATHVWKHCDTCSVESLVETLSRAGNVQIERVRKEVRAYIDALQSRRWLITGATGGARMPAPCDTAFSGYYEIPTMQPKCLGSNGRRRASPRGNSGPG